LWLPNLPGITFCCAWQTARACDINRYSENTRHPAVWLQKYYLSSIQWKWKNANDVIYRTFLRI